MTIDILTLFPDMFKGPFDESIVKRAVEKKLTTIRIHNLRNWAIDKYGSVDDHPYGGGAGMLLRPEPVFRAVSALKKSVIGNQNSVNQKPITENRQLKTILLDAGGKLFTQKKAVEYSKLDQLLLICGHYEGVDYRIHRYLADEVISIGDFVLTGGELPAMMITDSVIRLIPGVLTKKEATKIESFVPNYELPITNYELSTKKPTSKKLLDQRLKTKDRRLLVEYPQYTRPENFQGHRVPKVLLSGNHKKIEEWRYAQSLKRTKTFRPDLLM